MSLAGEFQIIYVDTAPQRDRSTNLHFLSVGCAQSLPPEDSMDGSCRREGEGDFTAEKAGRPYLSQVVKGTSTVINQVVSVHA